MSDIDFRALPVGIPWCRKENYDALRRVLVDGSHLPVSWEEFMERASKAQQSYEADGHVVVRAEIDPRTFPGWCEFHGHRIDSNSCYRFAAEVALGNVKRRLRGQ